MSNSGSRRGFALPAVLAVTGVVTLVFLVAITALASLTAEARSAKSRVRFLQSAMTAEAMLSYLAATETTSPTGFSPGQTRFSDEFQASQTSSNISRRPTAVGQIRFDGHPYELDGPNPLVMTLQDQAGMINLASLNDRQWERFGQSTGLPAAIARQLGPRYRDYVDANNLTAPGGAEQAAYGSEAVANRPLLRPSEWLSLLGTRSQVDSARWRAIRSDVAVDHTRTSVNINTASAQALQVMFGISEYQATNAVRARLNTPFTDLSDFAAVTGGPVLGDMDGSYTLPTGRVLYTLQDTRSPWTYRARLTLTPSGLEQPVWIDQTELTEAPRRAVADISNATRFPYAPR